MIILLEEFLIIIVHLFINRADIFLISSLVLNYKKYNFHIVSGAEHYELNELCEHFMLAKYFISIEGSPTKKDILVKNLLEKHKYDCDNTILISTSVIETLGLHVIEGIKHGVITIVPDEEYANTVYGSNLFKYKLFNTNALFSTVMTIINGNGPYSDKILSVQDDLRQSEMSKFYSIQDVFDEVINVQE